MSRRREGSFPEAGHGFPGSGKLEGAREVCEGAWEMCGGVRGMHEGAWESGVKRKGSAKGVERERRGRRLLAGIWGDLF